MPGEEKNLGLKIQDARKQAGFTQQKLCQVSGLSYSTLAKIERGAIKSPSIFTISQIAGALSIRLDELVGHKTSQTPTRATKISKNGVEFVYFDINGCLVHFYHQAFAMIGKKFAVQSDVIESCFWNYNDLVCRGDMSVTELNNILSEKIDAAEFDWAEYYFAAIEPIIETQEALQWVAEHYKFGLLSNIMPGFIKRMLEEGILPKLDYDAVIDSSTTGYVKPEPEIFELAREKAKVSADKILFIDDSRMNLTGAGRQGWHTLWFDTYHPEEAAEKIRQTLEF